jgi:O-antigen/teichoic acid export membrane protein
VVTRALDSTAARVSGTLRQRLARVSLMSLALKAGATVLAFGLSVLLARTLGPAEYGVYEVVIAWVTLLLVPAAFGLDKLAVRELSAATAREDWPLARGFLRWARRSVILLSLLVALATAGAVALVAGGEITPWLLAFWLGCLALPISALTILWESSLRGLQRVIEGQLPILVARPVLVIGLVLVAVYVLGMPATAVTALGAFVLGALGALVLARVLLSRRLPATLRAGPTAARPRAWLGAAVPLVAMAVLYTANARVGTILLGSLDGPASAGVYALASRIADLVMFTLVAVNTALSPTFASLHAARETERLQRVVTSSARLMFALAFPMAVLLFVFGETVLSIFGSGFVGGVDALRVLLVGQVANVSMGSVGVLMVMANRERLATAGFAAGTATNVVLALALIPSLGAMGAAIAATASMLVWNVVLWYLTLRTVGVHATVLGAPRRR